MIEEGGEVAIQPNRDHHKEGDSRRVEQQVDLVKFVYRPGDPRAWCGHDLLKKYVGTDEDEGGAKSRHQPEDIRCRHIECACKHDSNGQRKEGDICLGGVFDTEEKGVGCYCE